MPMELVTESELIKKIPALNSRILKELRYRRRIPFVKLSYRRRLYNPDKIIKALTKLEVQPK
jgi:hypothetical protein